MKQVTKKIVLAACCWGVLCAAMAAEPVSAAKKELVQKVVQLHQASIEGLARGLAEQPAAMLMQRAGPVLQERVAEDKREAVGKQIQADVKKYVDETVPMLRDRAVKLAPSTMGPIFEQFSDDELKTLIAWLESPVSRKYGQSLPELQKALVEKLVAETRSTVEPRLQTLERTVGKRLGIEPPPEGASAGKPGAAKPATGKAAKSDNAASGPAHK